MPRVVNMSMTPTAVPTLDELAADPARASTLPKATIQALLYRFAAVLPVLLGALAASEPIGADNSGVEDTAARQQRPYLNAKDAADYLCLKKSRLDQFRREGCILAARSGKDYTYRREHLDQLRENIELATRTIPMGFLTTLAPPARRTKTRR